MGEAKRVGVAGQSFDPATAPRHNVKVVYDPKSHAAPAEEFFCNVLIVNVKDNLLILADEFKTKVIQMSAIESYEFTKI